MTTFGGCRLQLQSSKRLYLSFICVQSPVVDLSHIEDSPFGHKQKCVSPNLCHSSVHICHNLLTCMQNNVIWTEYLTIFLVIFSTALSRNTFFLFQFKFYWICCNRLSWLQVSSISGNGLVSDRRFAITNTGLIWNQRKYIHTIIGVNIQWQYAQLFIVCYLQIVANRLISWFP